MNDLLLDVRKMATDAWDEIGRRQLRNDFVGAENVIATLLHAAILSERQRCANTAKAYLEDIAGCDMSEDEPDKIKAAVLDPEWSPPDV